MSSHVPFGGMGSVYQCTVVPRHGYYIDKNGNHINVPKEDDEVQTEGEVEQEVTVKTTRARTKKTIGDAQ